MNMNIKHVVKNKKRTKLMIVAYMETHTVSPEVFQITGIIP